MKVKKKRKAYKILGVDPGTIAMGFSILEVDGTVLKVQDMGIIHLQKFETHQEKLKEIYLQLQEIIETYLPSCMAVEAPFYGKNVQSMLKLGRAQGVAMAAAITMGLEITEYSPKKIKKSITGNGNATKESVAAMLSSMLDFSYESKLKDATDALAAAVTHYHQSKLGVSSAKGSNSWKSFVNSNPSRVK